MADHVTKWGNCRCEQVVEQWAASAGIDRVIPHKPGEYVDCAYHVNKVTFVNGMGEPIVERFTMDSDDYEEERESIVGYAKESIPPGGVGEIQLSGGDAYAFNLEPNAVYALNMRLIPYRGCCETLPGLRHRPGCPSAYFVAGQRVVRPQLNFADDPFGHFSDDQFGRAPMQMLEDRVSSDRTFENETRLH